MRLSDADIRKLIPIFMRDDAAVEALAKAVNHLITEPGSKVKQLRTWDKIDELDDAELDELAWELSVDWYSSALPLDRKRDTIKVSDQVHSKRGTKRAVEQLISAYFGSGYVQEWFDAGYPFTPDPFHFIVLTANKDTTEAIFQEFRRISSAAKSVRSKLDGIFYLGEVGATVTAGKSVEPTVFDLVKCGTRHKPAYIGKIVEASAAIAGATTTDQTFNFIKCGTRKTMQ